MIHFRCHTALYYRRRSIYWLLLKRRWRNTILRCRRGIQLPKGMVVEDTKKDTPEKPEAEKSGE